MVESREEGAGVLLDLQDTGWKFWEQGKQGSRGWVGWGGVGWGGEGWWGSGGRESKHHLSIKSCCQGDERKYPGGAQVSPFSLWPHVAHPPCDQSHSHAIRGVDAMNRTLDLKWKWSA